MSHFHLDYETAALIRHVFLPANPRKLRKAAPEVRRAISDYLDALYAAKPNAPEKESNTTDLPPGVPQPSQSENQASPGRLHPVVGCELPKAEK